MLMIDISSAGCLKEFEECSMSRDCCDGMSCESGNWAKTTNFQCLSKQSIRFRSFTYEHQVKYVRQFYHSRVKPDQQKSLEEIETLVKKHQTDFAKLVRRLENKFPISDSYQDEL